MHLAGEYQTAERMRKKLAAVPLPDFSGKSVLDVGCDHGAFCSIAQERGARRVLGLDRGRPVRGAGFVNLAERNRIALPACEFQELELGRQWDLLGTFDVVLMLNVYHHVFQMCADHESIWWWLHMHTAPRGVLIWEGPTDIIDGVARKDIRPELHALYNADAINAAAKRYFDIEYMGEGWVGTRSVWRCTPKMVLEHTYAKVKSGAGGASKAFAHADEARAKEIDIVLGFYPTPGSLNLQADVPFHYGRKYFRTQVRDVKDRKAGLSSEWAPRWCRFYPLLVEGVRAYAMRFEGERYPETLVELIARKQLRTAFKAPLVNGDEVCLAS